MNIYPLDELDALIKKTLSSERYQHSVNVARTARNLAERFDINGDQASFAGLAHDIARQIPQQQQIELARHYNCLEPYGERYPMVLHGRLAPFLLKQVLHYEDEDIDQAMYYHTTAGINLSPLAKILYIADGFEPGRSYVNEKIQKFMQRQSLEAIFRLAVVESTEYLLNTNQDVYPDTLILYNTIKGKEL